MSSSSTPRLLKRKRPAQGLAQIQAQQSLVLPSLPEATSVVLLASPVPTDGPNESLEEELLCLMFRCKDCDITFSSRESFREHVQIDHRASPAAGKKQRQMYVCDKCSESFQDRQECRNHMKQSHPQRLSPAASDTVKYRCPQLECDLEFDSASLPLHISCHLRDAKEFVCPKCPQRTQFSRWPVCAAHLWDRHRLDSGMLYCPICRDAYKTSSVAKLDHHVRVAHEDTKVLKCGQCSKFFPSLAELRSHMATHMTQELEKRQAVLKNRQCRICFNVFSDSKCLKKHVQSVHSGLKPYICHICNHKSARKAMLDMHMRQHTGEKPYECSSCSYRTGDHNSLRRHQLRHGGTRPYQCPFCPYSAVQSSTFKGHLCAKHPDESEGNAMFTCQKCFYKTINRDSFLSHLSNHALSSDEPDEQSKSADKSSGSVHIIGLEDDNSSGSSCTVEAAAIEEQLEMQSSPKSGEK